MTKYKLKITPKWNSSSEVLIALNENHNTNKKGSRHNKIKAPYNPKITYIFILDSCLCTRYGNTVHFKDSCTTKLKAIQKNIEYVKKIKVDKPDSHWKM